jgi:hypothetical protein
MLWRVLLRHDCKPLAEASHARDELFILMSQADRIRKFALLRYVAPAKAQGRTEILLRAGDIHRAMGLSNAMPAVCSAIGSNKFSELASINAVERTGPVSGANAYFRFDLSGSTLSRMPTALPQASTSASAPNHTRLDLGDAVVLVSCVKSKLPHAAPARALYTSAWFCKARDIVESSENRWFVLSALYGLVEPSSRIDPYDHTLNRIGVAERRTWANKVLEKLLPEVAGCRRVVIFAGMRYREFLVDPLRQRGIAVDIPMANLSRGEQLAWLCDNA